MESHLRFACTSYGSAPKSSIEEILLLQKKALRHVLKTYYLAHSDPLFLKLGILKIEDLISLERSLIVHNFKNNHLPSSFDRKYFEFITEKDLDRRNDPLFLKVPEVNHKHLHRNPFIMIIHALNKVPYDIKIISKTSTFKSSLTSHLLSKYNTICSKANCRPCLFNFEDSD